MERELTAAILDKIDHYIKGTLSDTERCSFEEQLKQDKQLQEDFLLQKQLFETYDEREWNSLTNSRKNIALQKLKQQLRSEKYQAISKNIRSIGDEYILDTSTAKNSKNNYYRYFAFTAIAVLLLGVFIFNSNHSLPSLYSKNVHWEETLPSFIEKGSERNNFTNGEIFFRAKKYREAIGSFQNLSKKDDLYPYSLMYMGASYELLGENDTALQTFDSLIRLTEFQESSKGYWYQLLIYLKQNNREKALETLSIISSNKNNYYYNEAQQLLRKIDK